MNDCGVNYIDRMNQLMDSKNEYGGGLGLPPGPPHAKGSYYEPDYTGIAFPDAGTPQDNTPPPNWPRRPIGMMERDSSAGVAPGPPIIHGDYINNYTAQAGFAYFGSGGMEEKSLYYYHSDHLGSTGYVTDRDGKVSQFVAYLPFGESLYEEHSNTKDMPYLFNGKERDEETGLYYYGARYYDPWSAVWAGVDPMWAKYLFVSPFVYCANNPIIYIDPDGRKVMITGTDAFKKTAFNDMQKLSSNNLVMLKNGTVMEASKYTGDKANIAISGKGTGNKTYGTAMISRLTGNTKHTVTIQETTGENNNYLPTGGSYKNAETAGVGSGGTVSYDPNSTGYNVVNADETTRHPAFIALGHELIHADKAMQGKTLNRSENTAYKDPDSPPNWSSRTISKEEVDTRKQENILRSEHKSSGVKQRKISTTWEK